MATLLNIEPQKKFSKGPVLYMAPLMQYKCHDTLLAYLLVEGLCLLKST